MGKPDADDVVEAVDLFQAVLSRYRDTLPAPAHLGDTVLHCRRCSGPVRGRRHSLSSANDSHSHGIYYNCTRDETHLHVPISDIDSTLEIRTCGRLRDPELALRLRARQLIELDEQIHRVDKALSWRRASTLRRRFLVKKRVNERSQALDGTKLLDYWFAVSYSLESYQSQLVRQRDFLNSSPEIDRLVQSAWFLSPGSELRRRNTLVRVAAGAGRWVIDTSPEHGTEPDVELVESTAPDPISEQAIDARVAELRESAKAEKAAKAERDRISRAAQAATRNSRKKPAADRPDVPDSGFRPAANRAERRRLQQEHKRRTDT